MPVSVWRPFHEMPFLRQIPIKSPFFLPLSHDPHIRGVAAHDFCKSYIKSKIRGSTGL